MSRPASVIKEIDYKLGQTWYTRKRVGEKEYVYIPVKIIGLYPYILLTVDPYGMKQAFTKACAFLDLFTATEAALRRKLGK